MSEAARMTLTAFGAGLPLAKPGFNGTVNGAEGETVEVAGGWYAKWLLDQNLASLPLDIQSQARRTPVQEQQPRPILGYMLVAVLVIAALALPLLCAAMTIMESW
jgi:hypothetical protein